MKVCVDAQAQRQYLLWKKGQIVPGDVVYTFEIGSVLPQKCQRSTANRDNKDSKSGKWKMALLLYKEIHQCLLNQWQTEESEGKIMNHL